MQLEVAAGARYQTKQGLVYHTLRDAIMRCQLVPGQRLVIEDVATRLAVSPIPVREALQLLQSERLVEMTPHIGAMVAPISRDSIAEIFTLMEGLEIVATRTAAQRIQPAQGAELSAILAAMDEALEQREHERWADLNSHFHRSISRLAGMPLLHEMTERALSHWDRLRRFFFSGVLSNRIDQAQSEHHAIVQAMLEQRFDDLEEITKRHNRGALAAYTEYLGGE